MLFPARKSPLPLVFAGFSEVFRMKKRQQGRVSPAIPEAQSPMNIEYWPLDRPQDYPKNARKWSQKAIDKVATSLREFGWRQPIVCDEHDVIIIGHLRRQAARQEGFTEVPVHVAAGLTPAQVRQLRLMDNRSHDEAEWDNDRLMEEMKELAAMELDLSLTGFDKAEFVSFLAGMGNTDPDEVPPVPEVATSRTGDLWLLGEHRLLCGDCTDPVALERLLGGRKPTLLVTDPPYGISLDMEWRDRAGMNGLAAAQPSYMRSRDGNPGYTGATVSSDTRADWSQVFELVPSIQVAYVWHASVFTREVLNGLERIGFLYPQQIIWNKGRTVPCRTHYWYQHEPCWYVRKKNAPWFGKGGNANATVWDAVSPKFIFGGSKEERCDHPTQKPVDLMVKSIVNHLEPGGLVWEPFGGSGTTLIAAEMMERVCCCTELEPKYIDVIIDRWQGFTGREATMEDGRTFAEISAERRNPAPGELRPGDLAGVEC
jgi:DNA modification methylase